MAKNAYENIERIGELLGETGIPALQKKIVETEKALSEILKKLSEKEAEVRQRKAEEAARAEEEARAALRAERAAKAEQEKAEKAEQASEKEELPVLEEKKEETPLPKEDKAEEALSVQPQETEKKEEVEQKTYSYQPVTEEDIAPVRPQRTYQGNAQGAMQGARGSSPRPNENKGGKVFTPRPQGERAQGDRPYSRDNKTFVPRPQQGGKPAMDKNGKPRPLTPRPATPFRAGAAPAAPILPKEGKSFGPDKKKKTFDKTYVEKKPMNKRAMMKAEGLDISDFDEDKTGYRKVRKQKEKKAVETVKIDYAVVTTKDIPIKVLSEKLGITAVSIIKKLMQSGIMDKTVNDSIDYDVAFEIADSVGVTLDYKPAKTAEDVLREAHDSKEDSEENLVPRAPVVTVMGHVDHGKTSLLDKIRSTNVTSGEAGGITQSIGAYTVTAGGKMITFIDTPGHAAFTQMRARGAKVTDIVILVVAADDGIMPQTVEAINHAKAANVPIIVAMNKIDKPNINPDRVKQGLLEQNLVPEEWGGDTIVCPVSAKTGEGIEELLENVNLVAEMQELKANPSRMAKGTIIEAKLDKGKGPIASVIIQNGTLHTGDNIISGNTTGRVRAMFDDKNRSVKEAGPSMAVNVLGLEEVPSSGDAIFAVDQSLMKQVLEERETLRREQMIKQQNKVTLDDVFAQVAEGKMKTLNLIVKADVQGSVEAINSSLTKLSNEEVNVKVIHAAAGAISESDVMLADSANAIIIGFNVRPDAKARALAESSKVDVRTYRIIYELLDDIEAALKGMLAPKYQEIYMGKCEVRQTFSITGVGTVAGCYVTDGKLVRGGKLRIYRDDIMIVEGNVKTLKRFKDEVKEVSFGFECGCAIDGFDKIQVGDIIECYTIQEVARA